MKQAVLKGALEVIAYLYEEGCVLVESYMETAINDNNLELVSYLYENGCPMPEKPCSLAISSLAGKVLSFLHQRGFLLPVNPLDRLYNAGWDLNVFKYLYSQGFKEINPTKLPRLGKGEWKLINYLHASGHVFDQQWLYEALKRNWNDASDYILSLGHITPSIETLCETISTWNEDTIRVLWKYNCHRDGSMTAAALVHKKRNLFARLVNEGFWDESTVVAVLNADDWKALKLLITHGLVIGESFEPLFTEHIGYKCGCHLRANYPQYVELVLQPQSLRNTARASRESKKPVPVNQNLKQNLVERLAPKRGPTKRPTKAKCATLSEEEEKPVQRRPPSKCQVKNKTPMEETESEEEEPVRREQSPTKRQIKHKKLSSSSEESY